MCIVYDDWRLADLRDYIDWTPFFRAWELAGNYPAILTDKMVGESAQSLFDDAQACWTSIIAEKWLTATRGGRPVAMHARWRRIVVLDDAHCLPMLRQQVPKRAGRANMCLADFIDPAGDWIGGFAVCAGHGIDGTYPPVRGRDRTTIRIFC